MSKQSSTIPQFAEIAQLLGTSPAGRSDAGEGGPVMAKPTAPSGALADASFADLSLPCRIAALITLSQRFGRILPVYSIDSATGVCTDRKSTRLNSSHLVISYAVF